MRNASPHKDVFTTIIEFLKSYLSKRYSGFEIDEIGVRNKRNMDKIKRDTERSDMHVTNAIWNSKHVKRKKSIRAISLFSGEKTNFYRLILVF